MLRAVLSFVVMFLVALPHGVCFCEFLQIEHPCELEASSQHQSDHDSDSQPTECSCKLREAMALDTGRTQSLDRGDSSWVGMSNWPGEFFSPLGRN
jgi:hypothetical protein